MTEVQILNRVKSGVDSYGNDVFADQTTTVDAVFAPGGSVERLEGGDTVTTQPALYRVPPDAPITATSAVIVDGVKYEVDGEPQTGWQSPFSGWTPGTVVQLRKDTG